MITSERFWEIGGGKVWVNLGGLNSSWPKAVLGHRRKLEHASEAEICPRMNPFAMNSHSAGITEKLTVVRALPVYFRTLGEIA